MSDRPPFLEVLGERVMLGDGGMGSEIYGRGIFINRCYDELNISSPKLVQAIHGDVTQAQRDAVMGRFRARRLRVLVATNLAARGLDIPAVSHVVNYDMPDNVEEYIHRIGRTARMGRPGTAITFVSEWDFEMLEAIKAHVGDDLKGERLALYRSRA